MIWYKSTELSSRLNRKVKFNFSEFCVQYKPLNSQPVDRELGFFNEIKFHLWKLKLFTKKKKKKKKMSTQNYTDSYMF